MVYWVVLKIIKGYQLFLAPFFGQHCRFEPTCSVYCSLALQKYGFIKGLGLGLWRIVRCNPYSSGGIDPVR
ncbi:membrane protein insertion efficiency factor YidD [bacterium (Candidatus Gribaldobacteria) CG08_land_8_20_14_0_20_39_15]|uniref:Putative membrane protein insertion efficiency factor n=1 Tax=bacterium (Candidatus Gribaldobacteria) CG08_land_8_20_14_0_20_39_15 TaxID=2014273 RepID=A0A2M6XV83_9BACT|nr:MAG: membrane protein insertion efficiency factor YidD [bacterium (Candidatus Gribaldobacteria) CG08_land_8_20_14_0_20_39_15]